MICSLLHIKPIATPLQLHLHLQTPGLTSGFIEHSTDAENLKPILHVFWRDCSRQDLTRLNAHKCIPFCFISLKPNQVYSGTTAQRLKAKWVATVKKLISNVHSQSKLTHICWPLTKYPQPYLVPFKNQLIARTHLPKKWQAPSFLKGKATAKMGKLFKLIKRKMDQRATKLIIHPMNNIH